MNDYYFNADDFGYSAEINAAIVSCFQKKYISTASMLVNMSYTKDAIELIRTEKLDTKIGLHFNITEGKPLTNSIRTCKRFCDSQGNFHTTRKKRIFVLSKNEKQAVKEELDAQIAVFEKAELQISHIDSHNNVHEEWGIIILILKRVKQLKNCKIRITKNTGKQPFVNKVYRFIVNMLICNINLCNSKYFGSDDDFQYEISDRKKPFNGLTEIMIHPTFNKKNELFDFYTEKKLVPIFENFARIYNKPVYPFYKPKVSVIIPMYNGELLIKRCLDSVYSQRGSFELEVIIIDDGSTDRSIEIVRQYNNRDIIILQQTNQGPAAARNIGIEIATGKYLTFLDADDYWLSDFLIETIAFLNNNDTVIAVNVAQLHKIPEKEDSILPQFVDNNSNNNLLPHVIDDFYSFWALHNHVCTGSVLVHTDIVKQTGGMRKDLYVAEDWEFWFLLATYGQWGFIPKVLFVSDGGLITNSMGWLVKMKRRWENAPSVDEWNTRISQRIIQPYSTGYLYAIGAIAKDLSYSYLLSNREDMSRITINKYKRYFPNDRLSKLLVLIASNSFLWRITCRYLIIRENKRYI